MVSKERQSLKEASGDDLTYRTSTTSFFSIYQRLESINDFLDNLIYEYPSLVSSFSIGKSYEGKDLRLIKISSVNFKRQQQQENLQRTSSNSSNSEANILKNNHVPPKNNPVPPKTTDPSKNEKREAIYLDGGFHAREWISVSTALFLASKIPADYQAGDEGVRKLLDNYDVYILPVANPDGYEYTHTRDRLWRKTRSRHIPLGLSFFGCRGVDMNRNFNFHWNEVGSSDNPCTDIYAGPKAFSEPESKAISDFLLAHKNQMKMFFSLHSYGELWLTPWGETSFVRLLWLLFDNSIIFYRFFPSLSLSLLVPSS